MAAHAARREEKGAFLMGEASESHPSEKKKICIGILAHVDAGKTTLSEALLYLSGSIRNMGRVDNKDAFLDTYALERERGITIFSKQAELTSEEARITLLDTPGHVDFSAEMERTLQVLDYAVLVVSGADGVQGHTRTLWHLLKKYGIPVFLFVNKMDQPGTDKDALLGQLKAALDDGCLDFSRTDTEGFFEEAAMCGEEALDEYLGTGHVSDGRLREMIAGRKIFPCFFGSALRLTGVEEFLRGLGRYARQPEYPEAFGAKVFKLARDGQGNKLAYLKVTGGKLKVKMAVPEHGKVNQIRIYSGEKFETAEEAGAGQVCAVTGLSGVHPGMGLGAEADSPLPLLAQALTYQVILPPGTDPAAMLPKLAQIEEEEPELHITWKESLQEIQVQVRGEVQLEILKSMVEERFGVSVSFGAGNILYKETIARPAEGVGHYEPLRHYAEAHLWLEPGERGSGLQFEARCSEDALDRNWQRLILTHLEEKEHRGTLIGAAITDMKVTLVAGRAHLKHTEGGDFRQATYRALRQGLMEAGTVLLEPYYEFRLEVPEAMVGRAMTDSERMHGTFGPHQTQGGMAVFTGSAPVAAMRDYQREVAAYTKGHGRLSCTLKGYDVCHNAEEVVERAAYDPERDVDNPADSVFCTHGAGTVVKWDKVKEWMHVESPSWIFGEGEGTPEEPLRGTPESPGGWQEEAWIGEDEVDAILARTLCANKHEKGAGRRGYRKKKGAAPDFKPAASRTFRPPEKKEECLLVDGYNIIFAWEELRELAKADIGGARGKLMDILCNYQGIRKCSLILVFDAYRVQQHETEVLDYHNIRVVYTKEAETADRYIEKFAHENASRYRVTVATSDGLEQIIIRGAGCALISARELQEEIAEAGRALCQEYAAGQPQGKSYLGEAMPKEAGET